MQPVPPRLSRTSRPVSRPVASRTERQRSIRKAFSLIELMIVITIIAILMSLLLVGVQAARTAARVASVTVEFKNMEKSIADFKAKFGAEPPSGIILFEAAAGWTGSTPSAAAVNRSRALIRQIWPDFVFTIPRDINGDGDMADPITLNGAECLVFFLGGVNSTNVVDRTGTTIGTVNAPITEWAPLGFSANPADPFARGGARSGPFHEFNIGRLVNRDGATDVEGLPEYLDPLPGQTHPVLYASSYGGRGYRDADVQLTTQAAYDRYATARTEFAWYYRRYTGAATPATVADFTAAPAFNANSCQLISPGVDGEYGWGGVLDTDMEMSEAIKADPQPATFPLYNNQERNFERDNITNFKGGTLN